MSNVNESFNNYFQFTYITQYIDISKLLKMNKNEM